MEKFERGQVIRSGHYNCNFVVIGYKSENHILAIQEGVEDKFTNRELLYANHCWRVEK